MKNEEPKTMPDLETTCSATVLEEIVKDRLGGRIKEFRLVFEKEGLILRGKTRTYYVKQLVQHLVMELTTVGILANDIEVVNGDDP